MSSNIPIMILNLWREFKNCHLFRKLEYEQVSNQDVAIHQYDESGCAFRIRYVR
jgi:hypothetical protein